MSSRERPRHDFNARSFALGLISLTVLAAWSHWHNVICVNRTSLNEGSPPVGGAGVFLGLFLIVVLWELANRSFRLPRGELVVIYAMLMVASPWMSHGIWYRFIGLVYTIPRDMNQDRLFPHYSDKLWPHGPQLNRNADFAEGFEGYRLTVAPTKDDDDAEVPLPGADGRVAIEETEGNRQGLERCVALRTQDIEILKFRCRIPTEREGKVLLVPGENYLVSYLARIEGARGSTMLTCYLQSERGDKTQVNALNRDSKVTFSMPSAFEPVHRPKTLIPDRLGEYVDVVFEFKGAGTARIGNIRFYNNEAIQSLYQGRTEVRESDLPRMPANERARVDVRPDRLFSPAGILHRLRGAIPLRDWLQPGLLWGSMILVLFVAILASMVIMRRQWADNERFGFPMLIFPRSLLEESDVGEGGLRFRILRERPLWIGFGIAFLLIALRGLHHYFQTPYLKTHVDIAAFFENNRPLYSFFRGFYGHPFNISLVILPIAFFIELELLGSILLCFLVCSLPFYLREDVFASWKSIKDFPFVQEQHTGAYMALAAITLYAARRHLAAVWRRAFGRDGKGADDSGEAWSYRGALAVLGVSFLFLCFWTQYVGVGFWKGSLYFAFILLCGLSTARIRAECGTPWTYLTPYTPLILFTAFGGAHLFGVDMFVIMIVSGGFLCSASYLMCAPTQVEMLQLGRLLGVRPRCISRGMMLGALGGLILGGLFMLSIAYSKGGMNMPYIGDWAANQAFQVRIVTTEVAYQDQRFQKAQDENTPFGVEVRRPYALAVVISFAVTVLLFVAKSLWVNFPLHPVGYILANTYFINMVWGSLFTAMVVKYIALKAGGVMVVRRVLRPFFVGMFLGALGSYLFWDAIALLLQVFGTMDTFHVPHVF
ncbi:MAG: hypothetical protein JXR77_13580 [Lentisphaeria bacterium]|nr:hypothetical protein [Lentisphaeria bacterium]